MTSPGGQAALLDLNARMRACRACLDHGHPITPGAIFSGATRARVMVIGQAPGSTEVEAGRPFNASSGARLFQWLASAGFDEHDFRARQYMTSVTKCYPGKAQPGSGDRIPSRAEQALCRPFLEAEIQIVDPGLIIPVGRLAINLYFRAGRRLHEIISTEINQDGRAIVPLPHPSGASRWHQAEAHRDLIQRAIERIRLHRLRLGL